MYTRSYGNSFNHTTPAGWIGREVPTVWPPWSPDLTPDFFLCGYINNPLYKAKNNNGQ